MKRLLTESHYTMEGDTLEGLCPPQRMKELTRLIPGIYADGEGRAVLNMGEFLTAHGLPDAPELRAVIWEEIQDIFGEVEVIEMSSEPDSGDLDT